MIGKRLAHYEIIGSIGKGGMGEVYRARDTKLGRDVAIKVLSAEMSGDPERLARFDREARTLATLQHPNIASMDLEDRGCCARRDFFSRSLSQPWLCGKVLIDRCINSIGTEDRK